MQNVILEPYSLHCIASRRSAAHMYAYMSDMHIANLLCVYLLFIAHLSCAVAHIEVQHHLWWSAEIEQDSSCAVRLSFSMHMYTVLHSAAFRFISTALRIPPLKIARDEKSLCEPARFFLACLLWIAVQFVLCSIPKIIVCMPKTKQINIKFVELNICSTCRSGVCFVPLECQLIADHRTSEIEFWYSALSISLFRSEALRLVLNLFHDACKCKSRRISFLLKSEMNHSQIGYNIDSFFLDFVFSCLSSLTIFQPAFPLILLLFVWT